MAKTATKLTLVHEAGTDRGLLATWKWSEEHTDHYEVWWEYQTKNWVWITDSESSEKHNQSKYSYPDNAVKVRVRVMPVAENKSGEDKPYWTSQYTKAVDYKVPKSNTVGGPKYGAPTGLTLTIEAGTDRTVHAKWIWKSPNVDYYSIQWQYQTSDKKWYYASTDESQVKESTYNAPTNAIAVRCRVLPVSKIAYETDVKVQYYWISKYTSWIKKVFPSTDEDIPTSGAPNKLTIGVQNGTDNTLYVTWAFKNHSITDHYEVTWRYYTGDKDASNKAVWYDGGTSNTTVKNTTYTPPDNARQVYYTVLPVAKELNGIPRFKGKRSSIKKYTDLVPKDANTSVARIAIQRETANITSLLASWKWTKSNTDHYEVEWRYYTGDKNPATGEAIWFYPSGSTSTTPSASYTPPTNAIKVQIRIKPVATGGQWTKDWTSWSPKGAYAYEVPLTKVSTTKKTVTSFTLDIQEGTDRTIYASWDWDEDNTKGYTVIWQYAAGGIWFEGSRTDSESNKYSLYSAPDNAKAVRVRVKPIAKTRKMQGIDTEYWKADATDWYSYSLAEENYTPEQPSSPAVSINGNTLKAEQSTYDDYARVLEFQVVKNDTTAVATVRAAVVTNHASVSVPIDLGGEYKVRVRGLFPINNKSVDDIIAETSTSNAYVGDWSEYSENVETVPTSPQKITSHDVITSEQVSLEWTEVSNVTGYTIEYTTDKSYFDISGSDVKSVDVAGGTAKAYISDVGNGHRYYARVRAVNDSGASGWSEIYTFILGTKPSPPTTWSDSTKCIIGDNVYLYWIHNSEDESSQSLAEVEITVNNVATVYEPTKMTDGTTPSYYILESKSVTTAAIQDDSESNNILDSNGNEVLSSHKENYIENTNIKWRVRTKGVSDEYSEWSTSRNIVIYAQPAIELYVGNNEEMTDRAYQINKYPLIIHGEAFPSSQKAISFNVSIIANESYVTYDYNGEQRSVRDQEVVYSKYIPATSNVLDIKLNPSDVNLDNRITYTVKVAAGMNSGLIAEAAWTFTARWETDILVPDAEVTIDRDRLVAYIRPFCNDEYGELIEDVRLSVFRNDYDGQFIELATELENGVETIVDPHPSLNYARYRVVAMHESTGEMGWRDIPPQYIGETSIIIQWNEKWEKFSTNNGEYEDALSNIGESSFVKLPYNIEVSESNSIDVALNEYIGRSHPVSYYGTQLGIKGDWNAVITRDDVETLYSLRRLAIYRGDAYVREPSGVGYWANVTVSFSKRYSDMTIPVTINVIRVEGDENNA